ncbi:MAG: protein translocase subunit SecD [Verrucomicrobia bacterium]|nr:protein translocase subunit SecD [Verrucomicrobiota bacterium]
MNPILTFLFGLLLLVLFGWYFLAEAERTKRWLGSALAVLLCAFCIDSFLPLKKKLHLGLDLQGGTSFLVRLVPPTGEDGKPRPITPSMQEQAVEVIRKRVDQFGVSEPVITKQGSDRILVQIPGLDTAQIQNAEQQLQRVAKLEFRLVHPNSAQLVPQILSGQTFTPPGYVILNSAEKPEGQPNATGKRSGQPQKYLAKRRPELTGDQITRAQATFEQRGYEVALKFTPQGADIFRQVTRDNLNQQLAIVLDGEVVSAPVIQSEIPNGQAVITGNFTAEEARNLASALENPLQTPVVIDETHSVSATLGRDSILGGVTAGLGGLIATLAFVLLYYRTAGLVAIVGLAVNGILLFGVMSLFNFVLTLPGIAGIILTIGMAIDSNVLIYERLREELESGKGLRAAIDAAYNKAFSAIFDANVTTLITAGILFWLGTGPVKGFAVTLTVGIIASMFAALLVTRNVFRWATALNALRRISMLHLIRSKNFDFLGKRRIAIAGSLLLIIASVAAFAIRQQNALNIDFTGGDSLRLRAPATLTEAQVRGALEKVNLGNVVIQREANTGGGTNAGVTYFEIRSPFQTSNRIVNQLNAAFPNRGLVVERSEAVGPVIGSSLAWTSLKALGLGILGILIYVTLRFEFSFALGAIVALVHDVIITLGVFVLTGHELSLVVVGAVLTIGGYSINDTIVVFDRIREGFRAGRKGSTQTIMNASINETLSRTLLTSGVTLLCMLSLLIFGGAVLADFAFTIVIGIVVGTYSSIFIASPIVLWWTNFRKGNLRQEVTRPQRKGTTPPSSQQPAKA